MEKSTHSERVAVALKIQAACAAALDAKGPPREADGYRPMDDRWRMAGDVCRRIDVVDLVQTMGEPRLPFDGEVETFEFFAKATHLNTGKRATGEYSDPHCFRAWNIWQMAMMFKKWNNIDTNEETMPHDTQTAANKSAPAKADPVIQFGDEGAPPTLKLGEITARLGFTVTADFLLSLGFAPAATEKNSKLFHEADFKNICAAIQRHIASVAAKYQEAA